MLKISSLEEEQKITVVKLADIVDLVFLENTVNANELIALVII
jgi:hypothetical protein